MVTRRSNNATRSESSEASPEPPSQIQVKKRALERRKTTANTEGNAGSARTIASSTPRAAPSTARKSLPSRLEEATNGAPSTPRKTPANVRLQLNSQASPLRTPGGSLQATAARRFEELHNYSIDLMEFYHSYCDHVTQAEGALETNLRAKLDRCWGLVESHRKFQTYPKRNNDDDFLDLGTIIKENHLEEEPDLEVEMQKHVSVINRAIFAHYVLQFPLRIPNDDEWTVVRLSKLLRSGPYEIWPIVDIKELSACRMSFFKHIVHRRLKVPVTVDDLYLYLDLCTQLVIYEIDELSMERNTSRLKANWQKVLKLLTSNVLLKEFLEDGATLFQSESIEGIIQEYDNIASKRKERIEALNYDSVKLHREFSFPDTMTSIFSYISVLNQGEIPLKDYKSNLVIPRHEQHMFSPTLRAELQEVSSEVVASTQDRQANMFEDNGQDEPMSYEQDESEEADLPPANQAVSATIATKMDRLKITRNGGLQRVEVAIDDHRPSIIRGRRPSARVDYIEHDEDTSDPFMENDIEKAKASKKRGRPKGSQGKRKSRANLIPDDEDEEEEEDRVDEELEAGPSKIEPTSQFRRPTRRAKSTAEAVKETAVGYDESQDAPEPNVTPRPSSSKSKGKGKGKERQREEPAARVATADTDDFEVDEEQIERERIANENRKKKAKKSAQVNAEDEEYRPTASGSGSSGRQRVESENSENDVKKTVARKYAYATDGNKKGRNFWTEDETSLLLAELEGLYPAYLEEKIKIAATIVERHGPTGSISTRLRNRNVAQHKDKARNIHDDWKRKGKFIPDWLAKWGTPARE